MALGRERGIGRQRSRDVAGESKRGLSYPSQLTAYIYIWDGYEIGHEK